MADDGQRCALVTGGTSGIGRGIAEALAEAGYRVTATGLTEAEAAAGPTGEWLTSVALDVTDDAEVSHLIAGMDRLDAVVNAAGTVARGGAEFDIATFSRVIDVNLTGTMRVCVAAKPLLSRRGGAIVNLASMLSFFGGPLVPAYTASKGGVAQLTKSLAVAWASLGIRVNALAPGWVKTELTRGVWEDTARDTAILARTPFGRWAEPGDVAGAAVFLCSDAAAFMTGTVLPVDGGYSAT